MPSYLVESPLPKPMNLHQNLFCGTFSSNSPSKKNCWSVASFLYPLCGDRCKELIYPVILECSFYTVVVQWPYCSFGRPPLYNVFEKQNCRVLKHFFTPLYPISLCCTYNTPGRNYVLEFSPNWLGLHFRFLKDGFYSFISFCAFPTHYCLIWFYLTILPVNKNSKKGKGQKRVEENRREKVQ